MPSWGEVLREFSRSAEEQGTGPDADGIRRRYLAMLAAHRQRPVILYATRFLDSRGAPEDLLSIRQVDLEGFMAVVPSLPAGPLDVIIHSPGGSAEAVEGIVDYLRSKFSPISAIVPVMAMSAATMLALGCDEIYMGAQSQLGPTDPQMVVPTQEGRRVAAAQAILKQFDRAKRECAEDARNLSAWMPILRSYAPAVLEHSDLATQLSINLVTRWLATYMFSQAAEAAERASAIARYLANADNFMSHARRINRQQARELGLVVRDIEADATFEDLVNSCFFATSHTFNFTGSAKIVENHLGLAFVQSGAIVSVPTGGPPQPQPAIPPPAAQPLSRAERRRRQRGRT